MMRLAYDIFTEVVKNGAYANLALKKALSGVESAEAGRVTALVYSAIEHISYSDYLIDAYAKGRLHGSIRNVLRIALTELLFMDTPAYAAVNEGTELTRSIGKAKLCGFVNAVLRRIAKESEAGTLKPLPDDPVKALSIRFGMPEFMTREYADNYGIEFTKKLLSTRLHNLTVRAQYPFSTEALAAELEKEGVSFKRGEYDKNALILDGGVNASALACFKEGRMSIQSESAMLVCRACRVRDGMRLLDTCAAPGGKTAYLSSLMHGTGSIEAWEVHPHRAELIISTLKRLHVENCTVKTRDASQKTDTDERYDVVLVDAPCSGLGGGSKPDALMNRTEEDVRALALLQQRILQFAAELVKAGGALVYSTCTVSKRENEQNIKTFLEKRPDFALEDISDIIPEKPDAPKSEAGVQLFENVHSTDGFYIARMIRKN